MKAYTLHPVALSAVLLAAVMTSCSNSSVNGNGEPSPGFPDLQLELLNDQLVSPVAMALPDDETGRIFICEQQGLIKILQGSTLQETPFLDLRDQMVPMTDNYTERGLLGIAFHPNFRNNRKFYVYYSAPSGEAGSNHKSIVAEYLTSAGDPGRAEPDGRVILEFEQPESNHNGGQLEFGPDGYLYIGTGDGGGAGDKHGEIGNGQSLETLLGKILRIDVNSGDPYGIPADNPFVDEPGARPEIWAYGLRNPWRFSFDRSGGRLFAADVGQNSYEEVDIIEKGGNYGWRIMEGNDEFDSSIEYEGELIPPIDVYGRDIGISITGGYVYRGEKIPGLAGKYVFADWTGPFFYLEETGGAFTRERLRFENEPGGLRVLSFGEDREGELYVLTSKGTTPLAASGAIYKIVSN